jgi:hypothetical protein
MMICRAARWMGFLQIAFPLGRTFTSFPCLGMDPFQAIIRKREGGEWKEGKRIGTMKGPKARMNGRGLGWWYLNGGRNRSGAVGRTRLEGEAN